MPASAYIVAGTHTPLILTHSVCRIVPEKTAYVVERFGKFNKTLSPGIHILIPLVSKAQYPASQTMTMGTFSASVHVPG